VNSSRCLHKKCLDYIERRKDKCLAQTKTTIHQDLHDLAAPLPGYLVVIFLTVFQPRELESTESYLLTAGTLHLSQAERYTTSTPGGK